MNDHRRHIDPMVDSAFKRIFGTAVNKDLLMAFRNEMFRGRKRIVDLVFNKMNTLVKQIQKGRQFST